MPIREPRVFILGAGASADFGFPIGKELRDKVLRFCKSANGKKWLAELHHEDSRVLAFYDELRTSAQSIDQFLEHNSDFLSIGKHCIAGVLLPCETEDKLFPPDGPTDHWYEYLIDYMEVGRDQWEENRLSVVTFNYDRSFEHYFTRVLTQQLKVTSEVAYGRLLARVPIVHVHGSLGDYPGLPYGAPPNAQSISDAASRILVVGEADDTLPTFATASDILDGARLIDFLGFGFQRDNVRRLRYFDRPPNETSALVRGTVRDFSNRRWQTVCSEILKGHWKGEKVLTALSYLKFHGGLD